MLDVVRGIGTTPAVKQGAINPFTHKIGFLQRKDVFFSDQSYRAQLTHFLTHAKASPLVLSYGNPDTDSIWNRMAPARHRDVVVLTPSASQTAVAASPVAEEVPTDDADNLLGTRKFIMHNQVEPPPPEPDEVKLESFAGDKLEPALAFQLSEAYKHLKLPETATSWVAEQGQQVSIIPTEHPAQAGFHKTEHRLLSGVVKALAHVAAPLFGLKIENNGLQLPNGQTVSLDRATWKNAEGQKVQVYQVRGLPDGTWLRLKEVSGEQKLPLSNIKAIRQQVSNRVDPWEKLGKVRDVPHVATSAFAPAVPATPEANPFTALSAVTPETSETFLY